MPVFGVLRLMGRWVKVIKSVDNAPAAIGEQLGISRWVDIDQGRVDGAKAENPYGAPVARGYLTPSLIRSVSKDN